jgi:hypothetical protein
MIPHGKGWPLVRAKDNLKRAHQRLKAFLLSHERCTTRAELVGAPHIDAGSAYSFDNQWQQLVLRSCGARSRTGCIRAKAFSALDSVVSSSSLSLPHRGFLAHIAHTTDGLVSTRPCHRPSTASASPAFALERRERWRALGDLKGNRCIAHHSDRADRLE